MVFCLDTSKYTLKKTFFFFFSFFTEFKSLERIQAIVLGGGHLFRLENRSFGREGCSEPLFFFVWSPGRHPSSIGKNDAGQNPRKEHQEEGGGADTGGGGAGGRDRLIARIVELQLFFFLSLSLSKATNPREQQRQPAQTGTQVGMGYYKRAPNLSSLSPYLLLASSASAGPRLFSLFQGCVSL